LGLYVENVNENADLLKYGWTLCGEVRVHEGVLASAVPEVENEVTEETNMVLFDVNCGTESCCE
jgi:hypothetical protein